MKQDFTHFSDPSSSRHPSPAPDHAPTHIGY